MQTEYLRISSTPDEDGDFELELDQSPYRSAYIYLNLEELITLRNYIDNLVAQLTGTKSNTD